MVMTRVVFLEAEGNLPVPFIILDLQKRNPVPLVKFSIRGNFQQRSVDSKSSTIFDFTSKVANNFLRKNPYQRISRLLFTAVHVKVEIFMYKVTLFFFCLYKYFF